MKMPVRTEPSNLARERRHRRFPTVAWIAGIAVIAALAGAVAWLWGAGSPRPDLDSLMRSEITQDISPQLVTDTVCPGLNCTSAWDTSVGRFVQFVHEGDVEYWQQVLGDDSRRNGNILLDMSEHDLDRDETKQAVDTLFLNRDWK
ncbi:hypothetical protein [Citricoccus nitrophenolicus]